MDELIIIEIGTNSIKELHARRTKDSWEELADRTYPTRLGKDISKAGIISAESAETSLKVIGEIIQAYDMVKDKTFKVIATESLRKPANADVFIDELRDRFNLNVVLLSGKEEAYLAYVAGTHGKNDNSGENTVIDIGGGSTELALGQKDEVYYWQSLPIGAVNLTERFIKNDIPTQTELDSLCQEARTHLQLISLDRDIASLTGVGGTITTLAMLQIPDITKIEGLSLSLQYVKEQAMKLGRLSLDQRRLLVGMPWRRAEIIVAGTYLLQEVMQHLGRQEITVSVRGVRHGFLYTRC